VSKWLPRDFNRREIVRVHRSLFPLAFVLVVTLGLPVLLRGNFMKRFGAMGFVFIMSALTVMYGWFRLSSEIGSWEGPPISIPVESTKHLVTPRMAEGSRGMVLRQAPEFTMKATDGADYCLRELIRQGPVLLTFIKIGCPCSEAAQPYFNRLRAAYPHAKILGVIDGELGPANLWGQKIRVSYPLLLDPDLQLVRAYGVENTAYVVLVDQKGQITMHWPGYSASMLQELGATLARLTRSAVRPIDTLDAPVEFYSGCPYDL